MRLEAAASVTESANRLVKVELIMDVKFNFFGRPSPLKNVLTTQFHGCGSYFGGDTTYGRVALHSFFEKNIVKNVPEAMILFFRRYFYIYKSLRQWRETF